MIRAKTISVIARAGLVVVGVIITLIQDDRASPVDELLIGGERGGRGQSRLIQQQKRENTVPWLESAKHIP